jgi:predicted site-specific integrase-resolvase
VIVIRGEKLLYPGEVARRFGVDVRTVHRWGKSGKLECRIFQHGKTTQRMYPEAEVKRLLAEAESR